MDTVRQSSQWFTSTHWSVVLAAGRTDSTRARSALERLCQVYWYPLYAFVRRLGHTSHDAEDLVQAFFAQCLQKNYLAAADASKGRFRSFLLIALKRFMANEWHRSQTKKRGAGQVPISLDALTAEDRYALEPVDRLSADKIFERGWAVTLLNTVLTRLEEEERDKETFEHLKEFLTSGDRGTPLKDVAKHLGTTEGAIKVAIHRLRRRYRELLEQEIANTVAAPEEIDAERRYLLSVLSDCG